MTGNERNHGATAGCRVADRRVNRPVVDARHRFALRGSGAATAAPESSGYSLRPGDVIFGRRPSWPQRLLALAGDHLSHCGVVFEQDGALRVAEFGPVGAFSRSVDEFTNAYELHAFLRPAVDPMCATRVARRAVEMIDRDEWTYSWPSGVLLDSGLAIRRVIPRNCESIVSDVVVALACSISRRSGGAALTCSGFVFECLRSTCQSCQLNLSWPTRDRVPGWARSPSVTDSRPVPVTERPLDDTIVRVLVSPFDLWVSVPADFRVVVDHQVVTILQDDIDPPPAAPAAA